MPVSAIEDIVAQATYQQVIAAHAIDDVVVVGRTCDGAVGCALRTGFAAQLGFLQSAQVQTPSRHAVVCFDAVDRQNLVPARDRSRQVYSAAADA